MQLPALCRNKIMTNLYICELNVILPFSREDTREYLLVSIALHKW